MRLIDADKIDFKIPDYMIDIDGDVFIPLSTVKRCIVQTPTEDAVIMSTKYFHTTYRCSKCRMENNYRSNFCPNCGAEMTIPTIVETTMED